MKKIKKLFTIYIILMFSLLSIFGNVEGATSESIVDWDDEIIGSEEGTTGSISYQINNGASNPTFEIDNSYTYSSPLQLEIQSGWDSKETIGWINLTSEYVDINQTELYIGTIDDTRSTYDSLIYITFWNDTTEQIEYLITNDANDNADIEYYEEGTGWVTILNNIQYGFKLIWELETINLVNYSVINVSDGALLGYHIGGWRHGNYLQDWNVMQIEMNSGDGAQGMSTPIMRIDDINITTGGVAGQGEGDTDLDDYNQRCTGGLFYSNTVNTQNISNYINSIGDVSIRGVELKVNNYQINFINPSTSYYNAYLNGVSLGVVDEIFQSASDEYTLQWSGFNIDVGTNDVILEFRNTLRLIGGNYWSIPMGYTDTANYGGVFGDGYFDGTLFDGYLGLGTCTYYEVNEVTPSDNTYALTLISVDPHWRGNTTSWSMTVTGDESFTWLIVDPNGNIVYQDYIDNANNIFYRDRLVKSDFALGEYIIYALDYDDGGWVTSYTFADNITFNVTAYGGIATDWMISASRNPILAGSFQGLSYFVPSGYPFAILWREESTAESGYILQGVGDGILHTIDPAFAVYDEGYWDVILQNRTSSNTDDWITYRDTFLATGSITNYIEYGKQGNYICNTNYATIRGFYDGGVGTLWFKLNEDVFKTFALYGGDFEQKFEPDDYEDALGVYVIYITNSDGDILDWSTGLHIEVYYCEPDIPIDPDLTPMYRNNVVMGSVLSLIIIVVMMILPYGVMMGLSKAGQEINIPPLVPIAFGVVGFIFSSAMMFIDPMYLVAFIVVMLIVALVFIYGKFGKGEN